MNKVFEYCCKSCWHMWKKVRKAEIKESFIVCPKCGSKNIDKEYSVVE